MNEKAQSLPGRREARAAVLVLTAALVALCGCRRNEPASPNAPPSAPTAPPITVVLTPTTTLPPNMQLDGKIDPSIARTLTAAAPAIPTAVGESPAERKQDLAPATPVPTVAVRP